MPAKIFLFCLGLFLVGYPLMAGKALSASYPLAPAVTAGCLILTIFALCLFAKNGRLKNYRVLSLVTLFAGYSFVRLYQFGHFETGLFGEFWSTPPTKIALRFSSASYVLPYFYSILGALLCARIASSFLNLRHISMMIGLSTAIYSIVILYLFFKFDNSAVYFGMSRATGGLSGPNILGSYLSLTIFHVGSLTDNKKIKLILIAVSAAALLATHSKGAIIATLLSLVIVPFLTNDHLRVSKIVKSVVFVGLLICLSGLVMRFSNNIAESVGARSAQTQSIQGRCYIWMAGKRVVETKTWTGLGPGTFVDQLWRHMPRKHARWVRHEHAHNWYIHTAAEQGLIGLFLTAVLVIALLNRLKKPFMYGVVAVLIHSLIDATLLSLSLSFMFWFSLGMSENRGQCVTLSTESDS